MPKWDATHREIDEALDIMEDPRAYDDDRALSERIASLALGALPRHRDRLAQVIHGIRGRIEGLKSEAHALQERAELHQKRVDRVLLWIEDILLDQGDRYAHGQHYMFVLGVDPPTVELDPSEFDLDSLDPSLVRVTRGPHRAAILDALRRGERIRGASLSQKNRVYISLI